MNQQLERKISKHTKKKFYEEQSYSKTFMKQYQSATPFDTVRTARKENISSFERA